MSRDTVTLYTENQTRRIDLTNEPETTDVLPTATECLNDFVIHTHASTYITMALPCMPTIDKKPSKSTKTTSNIGRENTSTTQRNKQVSRPVQVNPTTDLYKLSITTLVSVPIARVNNVSTVVSTYEAIFEQLQDNSDANPTPTPGSMIEKGERVINNLKMRKAPGLGKITA